jgi:hypothetical protein
MWLLATVCRPGWDDVITFGDQVTRFL